MTYIHAGFNTIDVHVSVEMAGRTSKNSHLNEHATDEAMANLSNLLEQTTQIRETNGDPYDFWRWTANGLKYDLEKIGFDILSLKKVTTGPRAILWFLQMYLSMDRPSRRSLLGLCHWLGRFVPTRWIHMQTDRSYPNCRVVSSALSGHKIYLALAPCAQRPL